MAKKSSAIPAVVAGAVSGALTGALYGGIGAVASKGSDVGRGTIISAGAGAALGVTFALIYHVARS